MVNSPTRRPATACGPVVLLVALVVSLLALAVYVVTLSPEVGWGDSAELALQAFQLGVTHPPGYPVHTFLGWLFIAAGGRWFGWSPAHATNMLSAVGTSMAAGLLCLTAHRLTQDLAAAALAGLVFALLPQVWDAAVVTEVYGLNIAVVALTLLLLLGWRSRPSGSRLAVAAAAFGISLGSYLPNLLFLPGMVYLLVSTTGHPTTAAEDDPHTTPASPAAPRGRGAWLATPLGATLAYGAIALLVGSALLSWSFFRSRVLPPLGTTCVPDTPARFVSYLSGADYLKSPELTPAFYLQRVVDHAATFARSFLWAGLLPVIIGVISGLRQDRPAHISLLVMFSLNMGAFTGYAATDYTTMVAPSYYIACLWLAGGLACLSRTRLNLPQHYIAILRRLAAVGAAALLAAALSADWVGLGKPGFGRAQQLALAAGVGLLVVTAALHRDSCARWLQANAIRIGCLALGACLVGALVRSQAQARLASRSSTHVTVFVLLSAEVFPPDAVVVAQWDKLPPLRFFQRTEGLRPDVTYVEPMQDWHAYLEDDSRPVLTDEFDPTLADRYRFVVVPHGWYRLVRY